MSQRTYMVERDLPGVRMDDLGAAQKRAIDTARDMTRDGTQISYLRSAFVPGDGRCMCLFRAQDAGQVEELNRRAQIPFNRVVEVLDLPAP